MAVVPKSLMTFGASLLTARAAMRLKRVKSVEAAQQRIFAHLATKLGLASVWKHAGVETGMRYDQFKRRVPLHTYEDLAPHIEEMKRGAADVLWPGQCQIYAATAGTTTGTPRHIPVTEAMLDHFRRSALDSMLWYTARVGHGGVFRSRHLFLGGSTTLVAHPGVRAVRGVRGRAERNRGAQPPVLGREALLRARFRDRPDRGLAGEDRRDHRAHVPRSTSRSWRACRPGSSSWRSRSARARLHGKARVLHLQGIWPNLECYVHSGMPIGPFQEDLRAALGPTVNFHEVYPSLRGLHRRPGLESRARGCG
jgi:hypothetical protein